MDTDYSVMASWANVDGGLIPEFEMITCRTWKKMFGWNVVEQE